MSRYGYLIDEMTWSYSRVAAFELCKTAWFFKYIMLRPTAPRFFAQYGQLLHRILHLYYSGEISGGQMIVEYLCGLRESVTAPAPSRKIRDSYFADGKRWLSQVAVADKPEVVASEAEYQGQMWGLEMHGFIDLVERKEDGSLCVTDFKSNKLQESKGKTEARFRQLYVYSEMCHQLFGEYPSTVALQSMRGGTRVERQVTARDIDQARQWLTSLVQDIRNTDDFDDPTVDYFVCRHLCDVCESCPYAKFA